MAARRMRGGSVIIIPGERGKKCQDPQVAVVVQLQAYQERERMVALEALAGAVVPSPCAGIANLIAIS